MATDQNAWLNLGEPVEHVVSWGETPGECCLKTVVVPKVLDEGMVVRLLCAGGLREGSPADLAAGAVWEVISVQEKTKFVLGQRLWLNPTPPCGICPACLAGCSASCRDSLRATAFPGWMSSVRVLHPWAVRRGALSVPSTVSPELFSLVVPMARAMRVRRTVARRDRVLVVGSGIQALLVGAALDGPGRRVLVEPQGGLERVGVFGFQHSAQQLEAMLDALQGEPDLVVLVDGQPELVQRAIRCACLGATVLSMFPLQEFDQLQWLWEKQIIWMSQRGFSPEDLVPARNRIVEIAQFLDALPKTAVRMEDWTGQESLASLWTVVESCTPSF